MNVRIAISTGSATAIYRQIAEQVRMAIATGKLRIGDQLPSVRALAEDLLLRGALDLEEAFIDATFSSAKKGAIVLLRGLLGLALVSAPSHFTLT